MRKFWWILLLAIVVGAWWYLANRQGANYVVTNPDISVVQPIPNAVIASPLTITGEAVGNWYFEASFPIKLLDANNQVIAQTTAQALSDWMTTSFVPFSASLIFPTQPANSQGVLKFEKDNPSGLPQNDDSYSMNISF